MEICKHGFISTIPFPIEYEVCEDNDYNYPDYYLQIDIGNKIRIFARWTEIEISKLRDNSEEIELRTRGMRKKAYAELRRKYGLSKKDFSRIMGYVGGLLHKYIYQYK